MKPDRTPTLAGQMFVGDCFGKWHDLRTRACRLCAVKVRCAAATIDHANEVTKTPTSSVDVPRVAGANPFRPDFATWYVYEAMAELPQPFTRQRALEAFIAKGALERVRIGNPERNLKHVLNRLTQLGRLKREGKLLRLI